MAGPTKAQLAEEITKRVQDLEKDHLSLQVATEFRLEQLEDAGKERQRVEEQLQSRIAELTARSATLEEKCRMLEKLSDRGWQVYVALFVAALAIIGTFLRR